MTTTTSIIEEISKIVSTPSEATAVVRHLMDKHMLTEEDVRPLPEVTEEDVDTELRTVHFRIGSASQADLEMFEFIKENRPELSRAALALAGDTAQDRVSLLMDTLKRPIWGVQLQGKSPSGEVRTVSSFAPFKPGADAVEIWCWVKDNGVVGLRAVMTATTRVGEDVAVIERNL